MKLWTMPEKVKSLWKYMKTAPAVIALFTLFSQQPANAKWINVNKETYCSKHFESDKFEARGITCEWWIAYTINYSGYGEWKSVKYDKTWKPQKCRCVWEEKTVWWWMFSSPKKVKEFKTILLDDGLWDNKNTTKK